MAELTADNDTPELSIATEESTLTRIVKSLGPIKLAVMAAVAVILIGFFVYVSLRISAPVSGPLYTNLSMEDSGAIVNELEERGVKYELRANGTQIYVPADQVARMRLTMAEMGLPSEGSIVGYELFDQTDAMGTSNFVLNVNKVRALEGELSRTISSFKNIESARVHLVIPKRELFTRDKQEPTASVALDLRGGKRLGKSEIQAIQHLVATAVPGLKASKITIVDENGRMLARGLSDEEAETALATDAEEFRIEYERRMVETIENLLSSSLGMDKIRAQVNADIDFDRIVTKSETYDPESQVARSVQEMSEIENSQEKDLQDNVTVGNNLPDAQPGEAGILSTRSLERSDNTTNFEISKEVRNHVSETGEVNRLSVAVLVDGTYMLNEATGEQEYVARSDAELQQISTLVKSAIGFDEARGDTVEVVNMQFSNPPDLLADEGPFAWLKEDLHNIVQTLVVGMVAVLAIMLIIRPLVTRAIEASQVDPELEEAEAFALAGPAVAAQLTDQRFAEEDDEELVSLQQVRGQMKSGTLRRVNDLIDQYPDEALSILRRWMYENKE
jgi:flagellar M-ring protein FliF